MFVLPTVDSANRSFRLALALSCLIALGSMAALANPTRGATTFVVNRIGDAADLNLANTKCDTSSARGKQCTLRAAIQEANDTAGADIINFNISSASKVIAPASPLPPITDAVTINGYSQTGASANTKVANDNAVLKIVLDGLNAGGGAVGLQLEASDSAIRGLVIQRFDEAGIRVIGDGSVISGNFIGTNAAGDAARGNTTGVIIHGSGNTLGGTTPAARNLISGNISFGLKIEETLASGNLVHGNFIGTTRSGNGALGNHDAGVRIFKAPATRIGGTTAGTRNVISGNIGDGVQIVDPDHNNDTSVKNNFIGTNASGTAAVPNTGNGVFVNARLVGVGDPGPAGRNVISGNGGNGVMFSESTSCLVYGNYIGTNAAGDAALANGAHGLSLENNSDGNFIGGTGAGAGNVISANIAQGILIDNSDTNNIRGNLIGTNAAGTAALGNGLDGIYITESTDNVIGGTQSGARNVISANGQDGIGILTDSSRTKVQGNRIGTKADGTGDLGNGGDGVIVTGRDNEIGGNVSAAGNLISGNDSIGVQVSGVGLVIDANQVSRNVIRLSGFAGVSLGNAAGTTVSGNAILNNGGDGIQVFFTATGTNLVGNQIFGNDELGIDLVGGTENPFGVTSNDTDDPDTGANNLQNFPVLTSATRSTANGLTTVTGTINSNPSTQFRLELFMAVADAAGHGEGQVLLAAQNITTNAGGDKSFTFVSAWPIGMVLTATATSTTAGNTSEFSANRTVVAGP